MIRNPYGHSLNHPRRLHFPVPEDIFASEDQVAERHERDIRSPAIDQAIDDWNVAKEEGDEHGLRTAATAIVNATSAAFKLQGVPTFAHPVLPPQFVKAETSGLVGLPKDRRNDTLNYLLNLFDPSVAPGGRLQFTTQLRRDGATNASDGSPFLLAQSEPYSIDDPPLRPTLQPDTLPQPHHAPPVEPRPKPGVQRPIGAKAKKVESAPPFPLRPNTWETLMNQGRDWLRGMGWPPPRTAPPPPLPSTAGMTWEQEFEARARRGQQMQRSGAFPDFAQGSEKEALLGRLFQQNAQDFGNSDPYGPLAPKDPHPEDPYAGRRAWPVKGGAAAIVTSPFGRRVLPKKGPEFHPAVDFRNPEGGAVFAPMNGTILRIEPNSKGGGNQIIILNDDGSIVAFAHTKWMEGLQEGDEVYVGQQIGISDGSGTDVAHTHMSLYPPGTPIDLFAAPPVLTGQRPGERYHAARKPPYNRDDHKLDDPAKGLYYKRLQVNPFDAGRIYGDRERNRDATSPRPLR